MKIRIGDRLSDFGKPLRHEGFRADEPIAIDFDGAFTVRNVKPLSATMAAGLAVAIEHGGRLERHAGGYWTYPGAPHSRGREPDWHVGASTVEALVKRGQLEYVEWKEGRGGKFPIAAVVTAEALHQQNEGSK